MQTPHEVIIRPLFTEKGTELRESGGLTERQRKSHEVCPQVAFEVALTANKVEIRQAVHQLFKVRVLDVNTQVVRGKSKRVGRFMGQRSTWKKAIVTLAAGENLDLFEGA